MLNRWPMEVIYLIINCKLNFYAYFFKTPGVLHLTAIIYLYILNILCRYTNFHHILYSRPRNLSILVLKYVWSLFFRLWSIEWLSEPCPSPDANIEIVVWQRMHKWLELPDIVFNYYEWLPVSTVLCLKIHKFLKITPKRVNNWHITELNSKIPIIVRGDIEGNSFI